MIWIWISGVVILLVIILFYALLMKKKQNISKSVQDPLNAGNKIDIIDKILV